MSEASTKSTFDPDARARYEGRVEALEAFGHRGSASENEKRAAEYLAGELTELGLEPSIEPFRATGRLGAVILLHVAIAWIGVATLWWMPLLTSVLCVIAFASFILESTTRPGSLATLIRTGTSQNVVATASTPSRAKRRLVVLGHYDTQRTGWMWDERLVRKLGPALLKSPGITKSPLFLVMLAMSLGVAAGLIGAFWPAAGQAASVLGAIALTILTLAAVILSNWTMGPYVPGANDNATGAAAVLSLAEAWLANPEPDVEVVFLLPGCEETGLTGAATWAEAHRSECADLPTWFLNIDSLGYGRPRFFDCEYSLAAVPAPYPAALVEMSGRVAEELGLVDAGPKQAPVPDDALPFLVRGYPGMSVIAFDDTGHMPNYHQLTDTSDRMSFDVAWQGVTFAAAIMDRLASTSAS